MSFSLAQQKALAIIPKITGLTSVFCSIFIVVTVLRDKEKRRKTYHRLLAGISLVDISSSFSVSMSTWPIPKDSGVLWAVGNDTTCRMQGFFNQFTVCSSFYNVSLSIYYLLVVRYGWKQHRIRRIEPALHAVPFLWGAVTAISGLPLDIYGNSFLWCFISAENDAYRWGFFYAPLWLMILIVTVNCVLIFKFVRKTEQAVSRHDFASQRMRRMASNASSGRDRNTANLEQSSRDFGASASTIDFAASARTIEFGPTPENGVPEKEASVAVPESVSEEGRRSTRLSLRRQQSNPLSKRTREVAIQSLFYAGAFYLNWFALTLTRLIQTMSGKTYFPILLIAVTTVPMQGLPNFMVYLGPRFLKARRERPSDGMFKWLHRSMGKTSEAREATLPARYTTGNPESAED